MTRQSGSIGTVKSSNGALTGTVAIMTGRMIPKIGLCREPARSFRKFRADGVDDEIEQPPDPLAVPIRGGEENPEKHQDDVLGVDVGPQGARLRPALENR